MLPGSRFTGTCWASTSGNPKVDKQLISQLATLEFTDAAQNLVLVGGTGTGKTHLATAIGVSGIQQHGKRVRFYSTVDLANTLEQEKAAGKQGKLALSLMQMDLVILDLCVVRSYVEQQPGTAARAGSGTQVHST